MEQAAGGAGPRCHPVKEREEGKCETGASGSWARRLADGDLTVAVLGVAGLRGSERLPCCPEAGSDHSHFIISPKPKEAPAPQSPAGCS